MKETEKLKLITQKEYDKLPGNGAAAILNGIGKVGQPVIKYAQCKLKSGEAGIEKYWIDKNGKRWKKASKFIAGMEY